MNTPQASDPEFLSITEISTVETTMDDAIPQATPTLTSQQLMTGHCILMGNLQGFFRPSPNPTPPLKFYAHRCFRVKFLPMSHMAKL